MSATNQEMLKVDRAEFDDALDMLAGFAGFADRVWGGNELDSMLWTEPLRIRQALRAAAGPPNLDNSEADPDFEARMEREAKHQDAYLARYLSSEFPEAAAS